MKLFTICLVLLLSLVLFSTAQAQDEVPTDPPPPLTLELLGALSATVFGVVSLLKAYLDSKEANPTTSDEVKQFLASYKSLILQLFAFAIGVLVAYLSDANLFSLTPKLATLPPFLGYLVTGFVLSLTGEAINIIFALFTAGVLRLRNASSFSTQSAVNSRERYNRWVV